MFSFCLLHCFHDKSLKIASVVIFNTFQFFKAARRFFALQIDSIPVKEMDVPGEHFPGF